MHTQSRLAVWTGARVHPRCPVRLVRPGQGLTLGPEFFFFFPCVSLLLVEGWPLGHSQAQSVLFDQAINSAAITQPFRRGQLAAFNATSSHHWLAFGVASSRNSVWPARSIGSLSAWPARSQSARPTSDVRSSRRGQPVVFVHSRLGVRSRQALAFFTRGFRSGVRSQHVFVVFSHGNSLTTCARGIRYDICSRCSSATFVRTWRNQFAACVRVGAASSSALSCNRRVQCSGTGVHLAR